MKSATRIFALLCLLLSCAQANAQPAIWQVQGKHNTLYLLGTIHMLPANLALPDNIDKAYREAEQLLMEVDMDDLDPIATQALTMKLGLLPTGQTLDSRLDASTRQQLQTAARNIGFDASVLAPFRPWLAAMTLEQLQFAKLGFAADAGIEMRLTQRAASDHKPIQGLETLEEQLNLFATLGDEQQREYLQHTLDELDTAHNELDALLTAWQQGDEQRLQAMLAEGFADDPKLFNELTSARNRRWMGALKTLLNTQRDDYLVAVGALHLIGQDGLVALLRQAGYQVTRQ